MEKVNPGLASKATQIHEARAAVAVSPEVAALDESIAADPTNPDLYMQKGMALRRQMLFREAIEAYSVGLSHQPFHLLLYRHRGHSYVNICCYAQAAADFEMGLRIDPKQWDCLYHLGLSYYLMGDYARAKAVYERCYAVSPTDEFQICTTDWYCLTLMRMGDLAGMKKAAQRIRPDMKPGMSEGYFERVLAYNGTKSADDVLAEAEKKDDHMFATGSYGLAVYFECVTGEMEKAKAILDRITQRDATWGGFAEHAAAERLKTWK